MTRREVHIAGSANFSPNFKGHFARPRNLPSDLRFINFATSASLIFTKMASITQALLASNPNYIYPLAVNLLAATIPVWAGLQVGGARKRTGLKYPAEYFAGPLDETTDREKFLFNCTQRAHQVICQGRISDRIEFVGKFARFSRRVQFVRHHVPKIRSCSWCYLVYCTCDVSARV
jgi:hypothetical protein